MSEKTLPRYPVYVPSKGRSEACQTVKFLLADGVPFRLVVEPQEQETYARAFPSAEIITLDQNDQGLIYARNWIKAHSIARGDKRHWQLDDNIRCARRWYGGRRIRCDGGVALRVCEDFVDRYENVAVAGLNYTMFAHQNGNMPRDPFWLNVHVYSCSLILNEIPQSWRSPLNDDTDLCLQVLAAGWCTVSLNAFTVDKLRTQTVGGGNTPIYEGDGRLKMARSLERLWPHIVTTRRRFTRPQHIVAANWRKFDTPLKRRSDIDFDKLPDNEYGMRLTQVAPEVKSPELRALLDDAGNK